jgi:hypothetical protein
MSVSNNSAFNSCSVLEKEKLNGKNFIDWYHNLRIVLMQEKREYVLEQPYPDDLPDSAIATVADQTMLENSAHS